MLIDPADNKPFYIGKGVQNRVFNHLDCALTDLDVINAKYDTIRRIQNDGHHVTHVIVRHGLTEDQAFLVEASLIDALQHCGFDLSNLVSGHNSIEKGLMTAEEICRIYNAQPLNAMPDDCIIININRKYERASGANAIYDATKGTWAINKNKVLNKDGTIKRKYVLSEYRGLIVEVFEVERWYTKTRGYTPKSKRHGQTRQGLAFEGIVAPSHIRTMYLNKSIAHHKKRGAATAHRLTLNASNNSS